MIEKAEEVKEETLATTEQVIEEVKEEVITATTKQEQTGGKDV